MYIIQLHVQCKKPPKLHLTHFTKKKMKHTQSTTKTANNSNHTEVIHISSRLCLTLSLLVVFFKKKSIAQKQNTHIGLSNRSIFSQSPTSLLNATTAKAYLTLVWGQRMSPEVLQTNSMFRSKFIWRTNAKLKNNNKNT